MANDYGAPQAQPNQYAPMDPLSQLIMNLPRQGQPALPPVAGGLAIAAQDATQPKVAPPTDDPITAVPRQQLMDASAGMRRSTDNISNLESKVATVNAAHVNDAATYKPHWYDRLLGAGLGALAGVGGNKDAAASIGYDVSHRALGRADAQKQRELAPLFTQLNQERDLNLPLYKEENTNALGQLRENREEGLADAREKDLEQRANKYGATPIGDPYKNENSSTGWSTKTADGRVVESGPPKGTQKPQADPKDADTALVAASGALKDKDYAEFDRLSKLAKDLHKQEIDRARESRPPKEDKGEKKTNPTVIEQQKSQAITKANSDYRRALAKLDPTDTEARQQALSDHIDDLRQAQASYETKIAENGGTPEHWDVDEGGNFVKAGGGAPPASKAAPAATAPKPAASQPQSQGPPASLWKNRENKILTLKAPGGANEKWQLVNGQPTKIQSKVQ